MQVGLPGVGRNLQDHLFAFVYEATGVETLDDAGRIRDLPKYFLLKRGAAHLQRRGGRRLLPDRRRPAGAGPPAPLRARLLHAARLRQPRGGQRPLAGDDPVAPREPGRVTLRSADPTDDPVIDPDYLEADRDLDVLVEGVRRGREILWAEPFDEVRGAEVWPGEDVHSDAEIAEHVRETSHTVYHPVGTCKMGDDEMAVVDDRLRVRGVDGLRVVDASVMPTLVGGNTNAPTMMIAEKTADMMREAR